MLSMNGDFYSTTYTYCVLLVEHQRYRQEYQHWRLHLLTLFNHVSWETFLCCTSLVIEKEEEKRRTYIIKVMFLPTPFDLLECSVVMAF